jgi:hypothetical protein
VAFDSDPPLEMLVPFSDERSFAKIAAFAQLLGAVDVVVASAARLSTEGGGECDVVVATRIFTKRQAVLSMIEGNVMRFGRVEHVAANRLRAAIESADED